VLTFSRRKAAHRWPCQRVWTPSARRSWTTDCCCLRTRRCSDVSTLISHVGSPYCHRNRRLHPPSTAAMTAAQLTAPKAPFCPPPPLLLLPPLSHPRLHLTLLALPQPIQHVPERPQLTLLLLLLLLRLLVCSCRCCRSKGPTSSCWLLLLLLLLLLRGTSGCFSCRLSSPLMAPVHRPSTFCWSGVDTAEHQTPYVVCLLSYTAPMAFDEPMQDAEGSNAQCLRPASCLLPLQPCCAGLCFSLCPALCAEADKTDMYSCGPCCLPLQCLPRWT
jgi:hypothetical protein